MWTSMPRSSSHPWKSASPAFASSTRPGTSFWNAVTWSDTGFARAKTMSATARKNPT
jgi:hypothetical protein